MIGESDWRDRNVGVSFMESAHWISRISVDFDRTIVDLTHRLDLEIIAPHSICSLSLHIG